MTTICPRCRQNAPLVYRGVNAFCTACGAPRMPLASSSVTLAGQPSKVGGTVARALGWIVLAGGLGLAALLVGLILLVGTVSAAAWVGGSVAFVTALVAWGLLRGGRQLVKSGDDEELKTKQQAIWALANTRGGVLRAVDVAPMLSVLPAEADAILTQLAKSDPDGVAVDIDDQGTILYRFAPAQWASLGMAPNAGMTPNAGMAPNAVAHVRVAPPPPPMRVVDEPAPLYEEAGGDAYVPERRAGR